MPRGGARINSGPKPGYLAERRQELQDLVARSGVDPAERILSIAKEAEGRGDWQLAMAGYKEILPLLYPRLKASQGAQTSNCGTSVVPRNKKGLTKNR